MNQLNTHKPIQFEVIRSIGHIKPIDFKIDNKGPGYYTYKPFKTKSSKTQFFNDAFTWLSHYSIKYFNNDQDFKDNIQAQLQGCLYNLSSKPNNLLEFFKRLKRLKSHHFNNWNFNKFLTKKESI